MINPGTDLKFRIESTDARVDLKTQEFSVLIENRKGDFSMKLGKQDCFFDSEANIYFAIENPAPGGYYASFATPIPDDDYNKLSRILTDKQFLVDVGVCSCGGASGSSCGCPHPVKYTQVWETNLDDGTYLCDEDGELILTADGHRIQFIS